MARIKKGGKYIAEGSYGCVFGDPPLKCKNENTRRNNSYITKLQNVNPTQIEYLEAKEWRNIDPHNKFSLTPTKLCDYNNSNVKPTNEMDKCSVKYTSNKQLLLYKNGGKDLINLKIRADNYAQLFGAFYELLNGLDLAHNNGLIHNDIKPPNILAERTERKIHLRFIDFGLSYIIGDDYKLRSLASSGYINYDYIYWPLEIKFLFKSNLYNDNFLVNGANNYMKMVLSKLRYIVPRSMFFNKKTKDIYKVEDLKEIYYNIRILDYIQKIDVYSLAITICQLIRVYFKHYMTMDFENNDIIKVFLPNNPNPVEVEKLNLSDSPYLTDEIIEWHKNIAKHVTKPLYTLMTHLLDLNPKERYTAEEAAKEYKKLLPDIYKYLKDDKMIEKVYGVYPDFLDTSPRIKNPTTPTLNYNLHKLFPNNNNNKTKKLRNRSYTPNLPPTKRIKINNKNNM